MTNAKLTGKIMIRIGYHVSVAKSIDLAFDRAKGMGCTAMQVFLSNPRSWSMGVLDNGQIGRFREKSIKFDITPVFAHMPYLPNMASSNEGTYKKSVETLRATLTRADTLGIRYVIMHLGSHLGRGVVTGMRRVVSAIDSAQEVSARAMILLENTAGQKNCVGSRVEELVKICDNVSGKIGFCLDTCHLFAAGYDIRKHEVLEEITNELGIENIRVFHVNDARSGLGSHLDRHENIGHGYIGIKGFVSFFSYGDIARKPLIMETPMITEPSEKVEIELMKKILKGSKAKSG